MNDQEIWKDIDGYPDYQISNMGRVLSRKRDTPRILKQDVDKFGYCHVSLVDSNGRKKNARVASLVMDAWIGPLPYGMERSHENGNSQDNRVSNLSYKTTLENIRDKYRHGTMLMGETVGTAILTESAAIEIFLSPDHDAILAHKHNISRKAVWSIKNRRSWRHVTDDLKRPDAPRQRAAYGSLKGLSC